jgi:hypothetical protein
MKKVLFAGLVAIALVAMTGTSMAWEIDVDVEVRDAYYSGYVQAWEDDYYFDSFAEMAGFGDVAIHGQGEPGQGYMVTHLDWDSWFEGYGNADQYMDVEGCCPGCCPDDDEDCECPYNYYYEAYQGAEIEGAGEIWLGQAVDYDFDDFGYDWVNGQELIIDGTGAFDAFQWSSQIMDDAEPEYHGWYGGGYGLDYFEAWGIQGMDRYDCEFGGLFEMFGFYEEDPCEECCDDCPDCPECPPECPPCPCPEC